MYVCIMCEQDLNCGCVFGSLGGDARSEGRAYSRWCRMSTRGEVESCRAILGRSVDEIREIGAEAFYNGGVGVGGCQMQGSVAVGVI